MPETYGLPEPELTRAEQAEQVANEVLAGRTPQRTVALYVIAGLLVLSPLPGLAILPLLLLLASDTRL